MDSAPVCPLQDHVAHGVHGLQDVRDDMWELGGVVGRDELMASRWGDICYEEEKKKKSWFYYYSYSFLFVVVVASLHSPHHHKMNNPQTPRGHLSLQKKLYKIFALLWGLG